MGASKSSSQAGIVSVADLKDDGVGRAGGSKMRSSSKERDYIRTLQKSNSLEDLGDILNSEDQFKGMVDKYSREVFHEAETLPAVVLMNNGRFDDLSVSDVQELFLVLDKDGSGSLEFAEVELLLKEVLDPPFHDSQVEAIYDLTDKRDDGVITADELLRALRGPVKAALKRMQHENRIKKEFEHSLGLHLDVNRSLLVDRLKWSVGRDDAFRTLPFSLVFICVFIFLVVAHLMIWERQQLERGLEAWVDGYGEQLLGPYLGNVADLDGMFGFLAASGLPAVLGKCKSNNGDPSCAVGTRNALVADVELKQKRKDGSEQSIWLLNSEQAKAHLKDKPGDYLGAARTAADFVHKSGWADANTMDLSLNFGTFCMRKHLFAWTRVECRFDAYGYAYPRASSTSVIAAPYPLEMPSKVLYFGMDAVYAFFLLIPMYKELKDLIHGMRLSGVSDGFFAYFGLWNIVDWLSIFMGIVSISVWTLCCQAMNKETIQSLLTEVDHKLVLKPGIMSLSASQLVPLREDFLNVISLMSLLRVLVAINACTIMMKFFKAFQANPRLQLVTNTMVNAAEDIFHFSVVLLAVFLGFAVTGHILFGNDITQFRTFAVSLDTCFIVLMGDFGWYAAESESDLGLSSGLPYEVLAVWFWLYMIFVLMILLNMLLAIILIHYQGLVDQIKLDLDVPALWEQTRRFIAHAKKTKGMVPLEHLVCLLEDDDTPCHPSERVSTESLQEAFPGMGEDQADHLMEWLKEEARKSLHEKDDEVMARIKVLEHFVETITQDIHVVKLNTAVCTSRLKESGGGGDEYRPPLGTVAAGAPAIFGAGMAGQFSEQVDRLTLRIGGSIRELTGRIGNATDEIANRNTAVRGAMSGPPQESAMPTMSQSTLRALPPCFAGH